MPTFCLGQTEREGVATLQQSNVTYTLTIFSYVNFLAVLEPRSWCVCVSHLLLMRNVQM